MVRTRADNTARKAVAAKAPRKNYGAAASSSSTSPTSGSKGTKYAGGNPYCPRPTPDWQKEITNFFIQRPKDKENQDPEEEEAGADSSSSKTTDNTDDIPTSSKTLDMKKIKKSKDPEPTEENETEDGAKPAADDKMEDDSVTTATDQRESEPMEVEIKIVDKKQDNIEDNEESKEKESPKAFQKNNCISDSEEED